MSRQQKNKTPWATSRLPTPASQKKRKLIWPVTIIGTIAGLIIVVGSILFLTHAQSKSPAQPPRVKATPTSAAQGLEAYLLQVAQTSGAVGSPVKSKYNMNTRSLDILETLPIQQDNATIKTSIEHDCFVIQRAIWHSNIVLDSVQVEIDAPGVDLQGNVSTTMAGLCQLKETTEQTFQWGSLTSHQAWVTYDAIWTNPALN